MRTEPASRLGVAAPVTWDRLPGPSAAPPSPATDDAADSADAADTAGVPLAPGGAPVVVAVGAGSR
ncbi:hypothetical protein GBW32_13315 [Streptomyces tsukubensis]|uniref:hypothetical protein n=1 Tax=Streptomyces tsukubensis TaxID=83656 RepID=UPI001265EA4C|nr:hypothetical protein [Streptomyces tsukubensis]QFR93869.1 hypothetical protein GBW32_13315 [Streptomyces tsukubensis]